MTSKDSRYVNRFPRCWDKQANTRYIKEHFNRASLNQAENYRSDSPDNLVMQMIMEKDSVFELKSSVPENRSGFSMNSTLQAKLVPVSKRGFLPFDMHYFKSGIKTAWGGERSRRFMLNFQGAKYNNPLKSVDFAIKLFSFDTMKNWTLLNDSMKVSVDFKLVEFDLTSYFEEVRQAGYKLVVKGVISISCPVSRLFSVRRLNNFLNKKNSYARDVSRLEEKIRKLTSRRDRLKNLPTSRRSTLKRVKVELADSRRMLESTLQKTRKYEKSFQNKIVSILNSSKSAISRAWARLSRSVIGKIAVFLTKRLLPGIGFVSLVVDIYHFAKFVWGWAKSYDFEKAFNDVLSIIEKYRREVERTVNAIREYIESFGAGGVAFD